MDKKLTPKQNRFVQEYLKDGNATQAAIRAGYKNGNIGRQLITINNVSEAIEKRQKELQEKSGITQERVLRELALVAFLDPRKFFDKNGKMKKIHELDEDQAKALDGWDVDTTKNGTRSVTVTKIKMVDKLGALNTIAKILGMFREDPTGGRRAELIIIRK